MFPSHIILSQIRGSLSSIQTLSKMLSVHMKKNEVRVSFLVDARSLLSLFICFYLWMTPFCRLHMRF